MLVSALLQIISPCCCPASPPTTPEINPSIIIVELYIFTLYTSASCLPAKIPTYKALSYVVVTFIVTLSIFKSNINALEYPNIPMYSLPFPVPYVPLIVTLEIV